LFFKFLKFFKIKNEEGGMKRIIIAGSGCKRCIATEENVKKAVEELKIDASVEHIYDPKEFVKLGVMITPAVIVDGKVLFAGKVPTVEDIKQILSKA
jgi:small redox-active disulfide protein 2